MQWSPEDALAAKCVSQKNPGLMSHLAIDLNLYFRSTPFAVLLHDDLVQRNLSRAFDLWSDKMAEEVDGTLSLILDDSKVLQKVKLFAAITASFWHFCTLSSSTDFLIGYQ